MTVRDNKTMIMLCIFVILVVVAIALIISGSRKPERYNDNMTEEEITAAVNEEIEEMEVNELSSLGERDRMEKYVSKFVKDIESGDYESAYAMLNEDFKTNYFKTLDSFEQYSKAHFPKMMSLDHTNFERIGDTYVLWVTLYNSLKGKETGVEMKFVVKESALNKYELSFSVQE